MNALVLTRNAPLGIRHCVEVSGINAEEAFLEPPNLQRERLWELLNATSPDLVIVDALYGRHDPNKLEVLRALSFRDMRRMFRAIRRLMPASLFVVQQIDILR